MPRFQCAACSGTYDDPLPDGVAYFHVCARIVVTPALGVAGTPGYVPAVFGPRPGARDENLAFTLSPQDHDRPRTVSVTIRADGAGRVPVIVTGV
jgi:hypothetical protein